MICSAITSDDIKNIFDIISNNIVTIIIFLSIFVEISPIQINPITLLSSIIFKPLRDDMKKMKTEINERIDNIKDELKTDIDSIREQQEKEKIQIKELIKSNELAEISKIRWEILEFSNSLDNNQKHIRDEYRHIIDDRKRYLYLIDKYELANGLIDEEFEKIKNHYDANKSGSAMYF